MHVQVDPPPHVLEDEIGLRLAAPDDGWRRRPDMDPHATSLFRASIVARARFIEDLVVEQAGRGVSQYVILGAGLDTFAQRRPEIASGLRIFEVDRPGPQAWKRQRLIELGFGIPEWLRLVPVDFEAGGSWRGQLATAGFDASRPAVDHPLVRTHPDTGIEALYLGNHATHIRGLPEADLIRLHRTLGRALRNSFRSGRYSDLFRHCNEQETPQTRSFDSISATAIRLVWEFLRRPAAEAGPPASPT